MDREWAPHSVVVDDSSIKVISIEPAEKLHFTTVDFKNPEQTPKQQAVESNLFDPQQIISNGYTLAWLDQKSGKFFLMPADQKLPKPISFAVPPKVVDIDVQSNRKIVVVYYRTQDHESWADVYRIKDQQDLEMVYTIEKKQGWEAVGGTISLTETEGKDYIVWTLGTGTELIFSTDSAEPVATFEATETLRKSELSNAISEVVVKADGTYGVRTFVTTSSPEFMGDSVLVRNGQSDWKRRESLSSIEALTWVELLDPATEEIEGEIEVETHKDPLSAYIHRLTRHYHELVTYGPAWAQALPQRIIAAFLDKDVEVTERTGKWKDFFGFRKYVVVVTMDGGIAAIDVGRKGEVAWEATLVNPHVPYDGVAKIAEVRKGVIGVLTNGGLYTEIDAFNGTQLSGTRLPKPVASASIVDASAGGKAIVVKMFPSGVHIFPEGVQLEQAVYMTIQKSDGSALEGFRISPDGKDTQTWSFVPPTSEEITSFSARPLHDPVASIGKVLGDRSVMYKYINPHLLAVATVSHERSTASIYLLDSVSGAVLHTATHSSVDTTIPLVLTISENWIVYTYYGDDDISTNQGAKGYHLVVSELYESEFKNDRGVLGDAKNVSSFAAKNGKPHVISQSYIFPYRINTFAVSSTKQGITTRDILASIPSGIYGIQKRVLDPRRPVGRDPNNDEREEGLFPYSPVVEVDPRSLITHERQVMGVVDISTTPSSLESTSLVFAYGIDLFATRVSPSMSFDILGKNFNKVQLVLTVIALSVGAAYVAPMVRRRQIDARWTQ